MFHIRIKCSLFILHFSPSSSVIIVMIYISITQVEDPRMLSLNLIENLYASHLVTIDNNLLIRRKSLYRIKCLFTVILILIY